MASVVDICNLALGHLGDRAEVSNIDPPDGSVQADHCARFYPMVRDSLLEMHEWDFAVTRGPLALLVKQINGWAFAYALPSDTISVIGLETRSSIDSVLNDTLRDERDAGISPWRTRDLLAFAGQQFLVETDDKGAKVLLSNTAGAMVRYSRRVSDPTQFSPLFVRILSWMLAGELAGPVMKGDAGAQAATRCVAMGEKLLSAAKVTDSNSRGQTRLQSVAPWIAVRR